MNTEIAYPEADVVERQLDAHPEPAQRELNLKQTERFFRTLFPEDVPPERQAIVTLHDAKQTPVQAFPLGELDDAKTLFKTAQTDLIASSNCFVGLYLLPDTWEQKTPGSHGREEELAEVLGFAADLDAESEFRKTMGKYPPTKDDVLALIQTIPLLPTIVVDSGYGYRAVWLFQEPVPVTDPMERQDLKFRSKRWHAVLARIWEDAGYPNGVDRTTSLNQLLRVPGTYNVKSLGNAKQEATEDGDPVDPYVPMGTIVRTLTDASRRYTLEQFDGAIAEYLPSLPLDSSPLDTDILSEPLSSNVIALGEPDDELVRILGGVDESERHVSLTRLIGSLLAHGMTPGECEAFALTWNRSNHPPLDDPHVRSTVRDIVAREQGKAVQVAPFPTYTWDALETADFPVRPPLCHDGNGGVLIPGEGVLMLFGDPRTGKTWLVLSLGASIALGRPFLGRFPTKQGRVIAFFEEGARGSFRDRAKQIRRVMGFDSQDLEDCLHISPPCGVRFDDPKSVERIIKTLDDRGGDWDLVVFDPLFQFHDLDPNSNRDMKAVVNVLKRVQMRYDCTVLCVHHPSKSNASGRRDGAGMLGASVLWQNASTIHVRSCKSEPTLIVSEVSCDPKDNAQVEPFTVRYEFAKSPDSGDGGLTGIRLGSQAPQGHDDTDEWRIRELLRADPDRQFTHENVADELTRSGRPISTETARKRLVELKKQGWAQLGADHTESRRHAYSWNPNPPTGWEPEESPYTEGADAHTESADADPSTDRDPPKF